MVARAHELSLAVPVEHPIRLAEIPARVADHLADLDGDVRDVPLAEKRQLLERLNQEMLATDRRIVDAHASYEDRVSERWIATSEGFMVYDLRPEVRLAAGVVAREESFLERAFESWGVRGGWRVGAGRRSSLPHSGPAGDRAARRAADEGQASSRWCSIPVRPVR